MGNEDTNNNPIQVKLKLGNESNNDEDLENSTRNLVAELKEVKGIGGINFVPGEKVPDGARAGEIVNIGEIVLTFITSGAMVAAISAISSWIRGRTDHKIKLELKAGSKIIDGQGLTKEEIEKLIELAK